MYSYFRKLLNIDKNEKGMSIIPFCILALFFSPYPCSGAEYRIDNEVNGVKSTVYLLDRQFVSVIGMSGEIAVFDTLRKTFTMLNPPLRLQTSFDAVKVKEQTENLCQRVLQSSNPKTNSFLYFAVQPKFDVKKDDTNGIIAMQSHWIDYELHTVPLPDESEIMYYDFCDWMCYLNMRLNPYSTMMLPRLAVNNILRQERRFAVHVSTALYPKGKTAFSQAEVTKSSHQFSRRLSDDDRKCLERVNEYRQTFPSVPLDEYQKQVVEKQAAKK
ncbi:MAG: hypothetical protein LBT46_07355 [Planctomycetaceae bacterium]|jgi:hypothetical protein|nr:hypothetical protein [Planctomycetaceae bacterium]